jgi:uncharacterized membrane protein
MSKQLTKIDPLVSRRAVSRWHRFVWSARSYASAAPDRSPSVIAVCILAISLCPLLSSAHPVEGDVPLYRAVSEDLFAGKVPYRDRELEYPPYAVLIFTAPGLLGKRSYAEIWVALAILCDCLIKYLLFIGGVRRPMGLRSFLPLLFYCLAVPFIRYFYFERYDIWPALVCLSAILFFCWGRHATSGAAIGLGVGIKVYPVVFIPALIVVAFRQGKATRFAAGLCAGLLPIALLSFFVPWWRFAEFQNGRGLQVESLGASVLWLGNKLGMIQAHWEFTKKWFEVTGPSAMATLTWVRCIFAIAVALCTLLAARVAARRSSFSVGQLARLLLMPLLAFVAFNPVFSPQFIIWLLPLAALASLEGRWLPVLATQMAALLTPIIYPSLFQDYASGLNSLETSVLVLRNLALVGALSLLVRDALSECCSSRTPETCNAPPTGLESRYPAANPQ